MRTVLVHYQRYALQPRSGEMKWQLVHSARTWQFGMTHFEASHEYPAALQGDC